MAFGGHVGLQRLLRAAQDGLSSPRRRLEPGGRGRLNVDSERARRRVREGQGQRQQGRVGIDQAARHEHDRGRPIGLDSKARRQRQRRRRRRGGQGDREDAVAGRDSVDLGGVRVEHRGPPVEVQRQFQDRDLRRQASRVDGLPAHARQQVDLGDLGRVGRGRVTHLSEDDLVVLVGALVGKTHLARGATRRRQAGLQAHGHRSPLRAAPGQRRVRAVDRDLRRVAVRAVVGRGQCDRVDRRGRIERDHQPGARLVEVQVLRARRGVDRLVRPLTRRRVRRRRLRRDHTQRSVGVAQHEQATAAQPVGRGYDRLPVGRHGQRVPVARAQAARDPGPPGAADVSRPDRAAQARHIDPLTARVDGRRRPVGIGWQGAGLVRPGPRPRGICTPDPDRAGRRTELGRRRHRDHRAAVAAGRDLAPVGVGQPAQRRPGLHLHIGDARRAGGVAPALVVGAVEVLLPDRPVDRQHPAVGQDAEVGVAVCRRARVGPGEAAVVRCEQATALDGSDDALPVGGNGHRRVGAVGGRLGQRPAGAAIGRRPDAARRGLQQIGARHGDRDLPRGRDRDIAPGPHRVQGAHGRDRGARGIRERPVGHLDLQRPARLLALVDVDHAARRREEGVQRGHRAGEDSLAGRPADSHPVGRFGLDLPVGHAHGHRQHLVGRAAEGEWLTLQQQPGRPPSGGGERRRDRHGRRIDHRAGEAQQVGRHIAREVELGRLVALLDDLVGAQRADEDVAVDAVTAGQAVAAVERIEHVRTRACGDRIAALAADQDVVTGAAGQGVVARATDQRHRGRAHGGRLQRVVALLVPGDAAGAPEDDGVVAGATARTDDHARQARGVEVVVTRAEIDLDALDPGVLAVELPVELHLHRAARAAELPGLAGVDGVDVGSVTRARAREQRQHAVVDRPEARLDDGRVVGKLQQLQAEELGLHAHGEPTHPDAPESLCLQAQVCVQVEQVQRPEPFIQQHRQQLGRAHLAVAGEGDQVRVDLPVGVTRHARVADVVQIGVDTDGDRAAHAHRHDPRQAHRAGEAEFEVDAELRLLLAAGALDECAVLHLRQRVVTDVEAVEDVEEVVRLLEFLDAVGVEAEGQVDVAARAAEGADDDLHPRHRREGQRNASELDIEADAEVQQRQLVGEQRGVAAVEHLGPVADVQQVGQEHQARTLDGVAAGLDPTRGLVGQLAHVDRQLVEDGAVLGVALVQVGRDEAEVRRADVVEAAQRHARPGGGQGAHHGRHVERELHRVEEGPVDRRLARVLQLVDLAEHAAQRRVLGHDLVQARQRRGERRDDVPEGLHALGHLVGDRQQEVEHGRVQVQAQVLDVDRREVHRGITQRPVPLEDQVGLELGQPGGRQEDPELQVGIDREARLQHREPVGNHLAQRQAARPVAHQIQRQLAGQGAGLVARTVDVVVDVLDAGLEEQQFAASLERRDPIRVGGVAVEVQAQVETELGCVRVRIDAKVEALFRRQTEGEIVGPANVEGEAAVDVEREARQVELERDVQPAAEDASAQVHVEADRIDRALREGHALDPGEQALALGVVEADVDVGQADAAVGVRVLQDAQAGEGVEQRLLQQLHGLSGHRPAVGAEQRLAQVQQQAAAQVADHRADLGQAVADEGQVDVERALEQALHLAQAEVDAVEHRRRVVQHLQQRVVHRQRALEVRQFDQQGRVLALPLPDQLLEQGLQTRLAERRVGVDAQVAQRHLALGERQHEGQVDVERTRGLHHRLAVAQSQAQGRRSVGRCLAVLVEDDRAIHHADLERARPQLQLHVTGAQARGQLQAGALAGGVVEVQQLDHRGPGGRARQRNAHARHHRHTGGQRARGRAGDIEHLAEGRRQLQVCACQREQRFQVQGQAEVLGVLQPVGQVDDEQLAIVVDRQVEHRGIDGQRLFDHPLGLVERGGGRRARLLDAGQQGVGEADDLLQRAVDDRDGLGVERLAGERGLDHVAHHAQAADDVGEAQAADVKDGAEVGHDGDDLVALQAMLGPVGGVLDVEARVQDQLEVADVGEVGYVDAQFQPATDVEARAAAGLDRQVAQARIGLAGEVELQAGQALGEQLTDLEACAARRIGCAVQRHAGLAGDVQARAGAGAARGHAQEAELCVDRQVGDIGRDAGVEPEVVDRHGRRAPAEHHHQVQVRADREAQLRLRLGGQRQVTRTESEVDRQFHRRQGRAERHRHDELAGQSVVARPAVAEQAGAVQRVDELADRADALALLVHLVTESAVGLAERRADGERAAVLRHLQDRQRLAADGDEVAGHGRRELSGLPQDLVAVRLDARCAARGSLLAGQGHPGLDRAHEVDLVDDLGAEDVGHVEHLAQGGVEQRDVTQAERVEVDGVEHLQHVRQREEDVLDADLGEVGQDLHAFGRDRERAGERVAVHTHRRHGGAADQVEAGHGRVQREFDLQAVDPRLEGQDPVLEADRAANVTAQLAALEVRTRAVLAGTADADVHRAQGRREHDIVGRQAALEAELVEPEVGLQSVGPVQREAEVDFGLEQRLHVQPCVEGQPDVGETGIELDRQQVGAELDRALESEVQPALVEAEGQPRGDARLRRPVLVQVGLQPAHRGHTERRIRGLGQAQRRHPLAVAVGVDVVLDVVTDAHQRRQVQHVVQALVEHRQLLTGLQLLAQVHQAVGQADKLRAKHVVERDVEVGQREARGVAGVVEVQAEFGSTDRQRPVHRGAGAVHLERHLTVERHPIQPGHGQRSRRRERQRKALARQQQRDASVDQAQGLAGDMGRGGQPCSGQLDACGRLAEGEAAASREEGRRIGRRRVGERDAERAAGLDARAAEVQRGHGLAAQLDGRGAAGAAIAVEVAAGEIDHRAGKRARGRTDVQRQRQIARLQRQAGDAGQPGALGACAQAHEGAGATGVFQHHQADLAALEEDADEVFVAAHVRAEAHVDVTRRQGARRHRAGAAVLVLVDRGHAARAQAREGEGALHQRELADADLGVQGDRGIGAARSSVIQCHRSVGAAGGLAGAHGQGAVHRLGAAAGRPHLEHGLVGVRADRPEGEVHLDADALGLDDEIVRAQAEVLGIERHLVDVGLQREPGAGVTLGGVGRLQQRQAQVEPGHVDALDRGRHIGRADVQPGGVHGLAADQDVAVLLGHEHRAAGAEDAAHFDEHRAADLEHLAAEIDDRRRAVTRLQRELARAAPIQRRAVGAAVGCAAQADVGGEHHVRARQRDPQGLRAEDGHRIGLPAHRQPAARVARRVGLGQHEAEVQPRHRHADRVSPRGGRQTRRDVGAGQHHQARVHSAAIGQGDGLAVLLEAQRAAEREEVADPDIHRAVGAHGLTALAVHPQRQAAVGPGADIDRVDLEVDHVGVRVQARGQAVDGVDLDEEVGRRQREHRHADDLHGRRTGGQRRPGHALQRLVGCVLRARLGVEDPKRQVNVAQRQADGVRVRRVLGVDRAVAIAVDAVGPVEADEGLDIGRADGQHIRVHGAAVGQRHLGDALLEGRRTADVDVVVDGDLHVRHDAQHLAVGAIQAHATLCARTGDDIQRRAGEVQHRGTFTVHQVDLETDVRDLQRQRVHAHQARRAGFGLEADARGHRRRGGGQRGRVQPRARGRGEQALALRVQRDRAPLPALRAHDQAPVGAAIARDPDAALGPTCCRGDLLAVGRHRHRSPVARRLHGLPLPIRHHGVGDEDPAVGGRGHQPLAGGVGRDRGPGDVARRVARDVLPGEGAGIGDLGPEQAALRTAEGLRARRGEQAAGAGRLVDGVARDRRPVGIDHALRRAVDEGAGRGVAGGLHRALQGHELGCTGQGD